MVPTSWTETEFTKKQINTLKRRTCIGWWELDFPAHMLPAVPSVHWGSLIPMTELSKPWNPNRRRKYHLWPPAACETVNWLESHPEDSHLNPLEWEHSCLSIYRGINLWQINAFWSLSKETLQYYTAIGILAFDTGHRWTPLNRPVRTNTAPFMSKPLEEKYWWLCYTICLSWKIIGILGS